MARATSNQERAVKGVFLAYLFFILAGIVYFWVIGLRGMA
jgi:hypothetical protein